MIDVKLREIIGSADMLKQVSEMKLRGRTAWKVAKLLKKLEEELNLFTSTREKLIKEYAEKDENGNFVINEKTNEYTFSEENMNKFMTELNELTEGTVHIDADKIRLDELENLDFTPTQMVGLEPFIEE